MSFIWKICSPGIIGMAWTAVCKLLQKRSIDLISQRNGFRLLIVGIFVTLVMLFQLGEVLVSWSTEKYAAMFNPFSDNIGGRSFKDRLCLPVPIDVVYTWVNGSDPLLLEELKAFKRQIQNQLNLTTAIPGHCTFLHCVQAYGVVIEPSLPEEINLQHFGILYPAFKVATESFVVEDVVRHVNLTVVMFESTADTTAALTSRVVVRGRDASIQQLYYTSDQTLVNSVDAVNTLIMSGLPYSNDESLLMTKLTEKYTQKNIERFTLHSEKGVAIVVVPDKEVYQVILTDKNITANGKTIAFSAARLVWDLRDYSQNEDISASRFEDNEELRYSLRSVEKYAPWVRHIYIVTNGQIPSWLNMDNPRLTVVSHEEIFLNKSHLPTFSSPAIESHLHRIKGLSDKFVYLNDDVMFGKEVWPDDFYTEAGGQKVYLTWPVPNCQEGCPASWIKDGYCDRSCNNSECEWDGGDCVGSTALQPFYGGGNQPQGSLWLSTSAYCHSGCANNWIADKYCDQSCNVLECAFDAGDCGVENFIQLHRVKLWPNESHYSAVGHNPIFFDYSTLVSDFESIEEGFFDEDSMIRSMSIAQKFKLVTLVMYANCSNKALNFSLHGKNSDSQDIVFNLTVHLDTTYEEKPVAAVENKSKVDPKVDIPSPSVNMSDDSLEELFAFVPHSDRLAPLPKYTNISFGKDHHVANLSSILPDDLRSEYDRIEYSYMAGELTENGFRRLVWELWIKYNGSAHAVQHDNIKPLNQTHEKKEFEGLKGELRKDDTFLEHLVKTKRKFENETAEKQSVAEPVDQRETMKKQRRMANNSPHREKLRNKAVKGAPGHKSRTLMSVQSESTELLGVIDPSLKSNGPLGFLPWEKLGIFSDLQQAFDRMLRRDQYLVSSQHGRRLLDTFANSLRHVSRIYNKAYGYVTRKVPAHIAHMIDKHAMGEMQAKFPEDWDATSSHRMRSSDDMQFAFAYFYFLMSEQKNMTILDLFFELDADHSGVLSDRELRTLAARLYELPLELEDLVALEDMFINCSKNATQGSFDDMISTSNFGETVRNASFRKEVYYDKRMPQVTLDLVMKCSALEKLLTKQMISRSRYRYEIVGDDEVMFKMIRYNVSTVVAQLDEIRKTPKKFVCLNDNIDYSQDSAKLVKAVLRDFYESILPVPSKFELPREFRNKFLHVRDLRQWWHYRELTRVLLYLFLFVLVAFALSTFVCEIRGLSRFRRRLFRW